eukprot:scaffold6643_cov38-Cyclotella_meneghiniana.AAC.1
MQVLHTNLDLILLGVHANTHTETIAHSFREGLRKAEEEVFRRKELYELVGAGRYEDSFEMLDHSWKALNFPEILGVRSYPKQGPYEESKAGDDSSWKLAHHFMTANHNFERIEIALAEFKRSGALNRLFGTQAIIVNISELTRGGKDMYTSLIIKHQNTNRSVGNVTLPGALNIDAEMPIYFEELNAEGEVAKYTYKTMTVRDVIRKAYVKIGGRKIPVFQYASKTSGGHYQLWFWDTVPEIRDFVNMFSRQGAAYLWHKCMQWGWSQKETRDLFQKSFDSNTAISAMNSKWSDKKGCAVEIELSPEAAAFLNFGSNPYILNEGEDKEDSSSDEEDDVSQMSEDENQSSSDESTVAQAKGSGEDSDEEEYEDYVVGSDDDSAFSTKAGREELDSLKKQGKKIGEETAREYQEKIKAMEIERQAEKEAMNARMAELEERNRQMAEMFAQLSAAGGIPQGCQTIPIAEEKAAEDGVENKTDAGVNAGNAGGAPAPSEAAGKNCENQSGKGDRGHPSRRARCRKSGRRATNYRLSKGSWAAKTTTINKLKHEEVVAMIDKRSYGARRSRITDDNIRDWVESEAFESRNAASMSILESKLNETSAAKDYPAHGSAEEKRPDGVFRGMSVQLNGMVTSKVMNRKARLLTAAIKKYEVQFVGLGEVGVNWKKANRKRLLSLLPELTGEARTMTANNTTENVAVHQQGGVATLALGEIINYYKKGPKDFRQLGRWTSFTLQSITPRPQNQNSSSLRRENEPF